MQCRLSDLILEFEASSSPHIKCYKLYYEESPNPVTYESKHVVIGKKTSVILNDVEELQQLCGLYNLGLVAVDEAGNESCMSRINDFAIICDPPESPGELLFRRRKRLDP